MKLHVSEDTMPYIDRFFQETPQFIDKLPSFQEVFAAKEEVGWKEGQRQTLLRLLNRKFGPLPETVVTQTEETDSSAQLTEWLDRLVEVDALDEMGFEKN